MPVFVVSVSATFTGPARAAEIAAALLAHADVVTVRIAAGESVFRVDVEADDEALAARAAIAVGVAVARALGGDARVGSVSVIDEAERERLGMAPPQM